MSEQPRPTPTGGPRIVDLVKADLDLRLERGIKTYGTPLQAFNGRDALQDAYEEALDLACYLRQEMAERDATPGGPWIGVDFDGTLAKYTYWQGDAVLGEPIAPMVERVRVWVAEGIHVRIVTARATRPLAVAAIKAWCVEQGLPPLPVTDRKDFQMVALWDDRVVQVGRNTGLPTSVMEVVA